MGLAIALVGESEDMLDDALQHDIDLINETLRQEGLPEHREPAPGTIPASRAECGGFPYSFLHYLRRIVANVTLDPKWQATPTTGDPTEDKAMTHYEEDLTIHTLAHSDCEGYYVPVDFPEVLMVGEPGDLPGAIIGSSNRMLAELIECAPSLGIKLENGKLSDAEAKRINDEASEDKGMYRELTVWLALYEAARISVEHGTAILFT